MNITLETMFPILVSTKLYLLCVVGINQFMAEKPGGSSYKAHTLLLTLSPTSTAIEGFRYKASMPTQFSNLTVVCTVL